MNYGKTSESKLWSKVCNTWNPSIWEFHDDELLPDKMDIELPLECFTGLDNHCPLAMQVISVHPIVEVITMSNLLDLVTQTNK